MNTPELDRLLSQLRHDTPAPSVSLVSGIFPRLGPSARQVRTMLYTGVGTCFAAVAVAALIGASVAKGPDEAAPPELTLLTRGTGPLASL